MGWSYTASDAAVSPKNQPAQTPSGLADFLRVRQKCQPVGQVNDHFYLINICPYFLQNSKNRKKMQAPDMEKKQI